MNFKDFLNEETKYYSAVFDFDGTLYDAEELRDGDLWKYVEKQKHVPIDSIPVEEEGYESSKVHFLCKNKCSKKEWDPFVKEVERKFRDLKFSYLGK